MGHDTRNALILAAIALSALALAAGATVAGASAGGGRRPRWVVAVVVLVGGATAGLVTLAIGREPDVSAARLRAGIALAALLAVGAMTVYALLGYALARHRAWLTVAWIALIAPLLVFVAVAVVVVATKTACGPDDYGCPLYIGAMQLAPP